MKKKLRVREKDLMEKKKVKEGESRKRKTRRLMSTRRIGWKSGEGPEGRAARWPRSSSR